jgi:hypothetical protein
MMIRGRVAIYLRDYWIILLAPLLLVLPLMARGQVLYWGTPSLQFVPWWSYALDCLRQGVLPLWNPLNGFGAPLIANYQLAFFYPPNWLLLLFGILAGQANQAVAIAWGFMLLSVLHLAWAGLGMALLLKRLGFGWLGQVVGGMAFGISGYVVARLGFFSMVWVYAWLPWVIYTTDPIAPVGREEPDNSGDRVRLMPGLVLCLSMQLLAGHAQLTWYTLLLAVVWVTVGSLHGGGLRRLVMGGLSLASAGLVAAGLAAVQLLPTFEYLTQSQRADAYAFEEALTFSFWPWRLITILSPDFFGSPAAGDFWGYASYWEDHIYMGVLPVLLALATFWLVLRGLRRSGRGREWRLLLLAWSGLLVTFVLAMGRYTPVFPFLYRYVPTFDMFQAPARYLVWSVFLFPVLAAVGIDHWRCPTGRGLYWFRLGTAGAFAVTLGAGLAWLFMQNIKVTFIRATALTGLWALGFGLLTLAIPLAEKYNRRGLWRWAVIAWTLADLLVAGWSLNPGVESGFYRGASPAAHQEISASDQRVFITAREERDLKFGRFLRFTDFRQQEDPYAQRQALLPNLNLLDRVASANNFDPLVPDRYARWMAEVETLNLNTQSGWLARMGIGWVEHVDGSQPTGVRFDPIEGASRWWWYPCARAAGGLEEAVSLLSGEIDAGASILGPVVVEGNLGSDGGQCPVGGEVSVRIRLESEKPDRLVLAVSTTSPGWLVLADTWYPGWRATVDSTPVTLYPANVLFRAVQLPAGKHRIIIEYRPIGFYFGALFSILVLLCAIIRWDKWGRDSNRKPSLAMKQPE